MKQHNFKITDHDFDLKTRFSHFLRSSRPMIFYMVFYVGFLTQAEKNHVAITKLKE